MAKKGKKGGAKEKGGKKKKSDENDAPIAEEEQKRRELARKAKELSDFTKKEEQTFNEFQQQREKLNYFWIVEKKNLEDKKAELRNKQREAQDLEEKHQVEIKVYKQRVKHLLYEHQDQITQLKTEAEVKLSSVQDTHRDDERELKSDRRAFKLDLKEMELAHEDYLKTIKQEQDRNISLLRQEFERTAKELQQKYERKRKTVRDELDSKRRIETQRIEERKNAHIAQLMTAHEKAFGEIKNYYNDITHNNLDLIKSLKEEVAEMKKKESQDEKLMFEIAQENKRMSEPLKQALQDVERLRNDLQKYNGDKQELKKSKAALLILEDQMHNLTWEHEVLQQRYAQVCKEKNQLYDEFQSTMYDVQQKTGFKNLLLEKKLANMTEVLEQKDAQLNEVLAHAQLDPSVLGQVRGRLEDIMEQKNQSIRDLEKELEFIKNEHCALIQTTNNILISNGIPVDELGFLPKLSIPNSPNKSKIGEKKIIKA